MRNLIYKALFLLITKEEKCLTFLIRNNKQIRFSSSSSSSLSSSTLVKSATQPHIANGQNEEIIVAKTGPTGVKTASEEASLKNLSLGAPKKAKPKGGHYMTKGGGIQITTNVNFLKYNGNQMTQYLSNLISSLDYERGCLLSSSYEFPGRYARWTIGFRNPPIEIVGSGSKCTFTALNDRGKVLLPAMINCIQQYQAKHTDIIASVEYTDTTCDIAINTQATQVFSEEDRSKQPSLFTILRALQQYFQFDSDDEQLGFYGAFGYDLTFQFEAVKLHQQRSADQRDLVLYLPDEIFVMDADKHQSYVLSYDFVVGSTTTVGLQRTGSIDPFQASTAAPISDRDTPPNEFSKSVQRAKHEFKVGNLFEVVLSQTFREKLSEENTPSAIFKRLQARNPSPFGFLINLGQQEYLVGASPEMFVRCEYVQSQEQQRVLRVETCPISGTVARGADALEDAKRIKSIIMNPKEESELTMCTDVDRNDKSRICIPGTVKVIGRRQIEMYSKLIHTVDHVEGYLRPEYDALDAFLCHTWAVTVTGAPKTWAIQFVEEMEKSPRCWYGGAVGVIGCNGSMNTGLTLRTVRIKHGIAEVRAGATLLYDSDPQAEEKETELKASAMIDAIVRPDLKLSTTSTENNNPIQNNVGLGKKIILIDHQDSFVHTLGNYLRQTGADVQTLRSGDNALNAIQQMVLQNSKPDMVVLSPGPGNPTDFQLSKSLQVLTQNQIPVFGVCLGLQGIVEYFGGTLGILDYPMHGKPSHVSLTSQGSAPNSIFTNLPTQFEVARYHSLYGLQDHTFPSCLEITATTDADNIVMAIQHKTLPIAAVQFHPESILTNPLHGLTILKNALMFLKYD